MFVNIIFLLIEIFREKYHLDLFGIVKAAKIIFVQCVTIRSVLAFAANCLNSQCVVFLKFR